MSEHIATLSWSLDVDCPQCKESVDLVGLDANCDYGIARRIFNNEWDSLKGYEITCPHCNHEFALDGVEY